MFETEREMMRTKETNRTAVIRPSYYYLHFALLNRILCRFEQSESAPSRLS